MYGNIGHLLLEDNKQLGWFEYTSHWQKWHLTLKHHTKKVITSFSDDMQWEVIISYLIL